MARKVVEIRIVRGLPEIALFFFDRENTARHRIIVRTDHDGRLVGEAAAALAPSYQILVTEK